MRKVLIVSILVSISCVATVKAAALRTVALTGQSVPGAQVGVTFESFSPHYQLGDGVLEPLFRGPVLNDSGQTAFRANVVGSDVGAANNQGVWSEGAGELALVARTGTQAPGAPSGVNFGKYSGLELFTPVLNNAGQTAFYGALADGRLGLWSEGTGSLKLVAADGVHAPVLPNGVNFSFGTIHELNKWIFTDFPLLNDAGQTSVSAGLAGTGVNVTNNFGTWFGNDLNSLALLARRGSPAPGTSASTVFGELQLVTSINELGQAAMIASLQGNGVVGFWAGSPGGLTLVSRDGTPAPGTAGGVNFIDYFAPIASNNAGQIVFEAVLFGGDVVEGINDEGLWSDVSGSLELVVRRGSQAAGAPPGTNYGSFTFSSWPLLNDAGQIAFHAGLEGDGVDEGNNEGIWVGAPGSLALVARRGLQAPDSESGVSFADLNYPALNSTGQIAFRAIVAGDSVNSTNDRGIWATDASGELQIVARTGGELEVAPGDVRTLTDLDFVIATGNSDGRRSAFNNRGQLVFWASFTDGSQGVFVSSAVAHLPGDFNNDGTVDAADYVVWRTNAGTQAGYDRWRANFGTSLNASGASGSASASAASMRATIPEPANDILVLTGLAVFIWRRHSLKTTQPSR
jgi:hypothetical protein